MLLVHKIPIIGLLLIVITTLITEWCIRHQKLNIFIARKILHVVAIGTCSYVIYSSGSMQYLPAIFLCSSIILGIVVYKKKLQSSSISNSYGIALFPFAFFLLLQCNLFTTVQVAISATTLTFADALAGLVGYYFGKIKMVFLQEQKSVLGFFVFYSTSVIIYSCFYGLGAWQLALLYGIVPALSELFSYRGSDNLCVPIAACCWAYLLQQSDIQSLYTSAIYMVALLPLAYIALRKCWLTPTAIIAALYLAINILFYGGLLYFVPMVVFFIVGSIITFATKKKKLFAIEKSKARTATQVFVNGGVAVVCMVLYNITSNNMYAIAYLASIAISLTDTVSSEVGTYYGHKTYDVFTMKKIHAGLSGGVSIIGTVAGIVTAILFGGLAYFLFAISVVQVSIVILLGIIGMLVDSMLGSTLQAKYRNYYGSMVEYKTPYVIRGYKWCTNNVVNLLSNTFTIFTLIVVYYFLR